MKSNGMILKEALGILFSEWFGRIILADIVLNFVVFVVMGNMVEVFHDIGAYTLNDYFSARALHHLGVGGETALPDAISTQMLLPTIFLQFFVFLFKAIVVFGLARVVLKSVRGDVKGWFSASFGGFCRPFEVTWLYFRMWVQVLLWSLLLVVPGIVAMYRYRQAWYLKSDNPDWSAGKCLAVSGEMMRGLKWQAFCLDLPYYLVNMVIFGLVAAGLFVAAMAKSSFFSMLAKTAAPMAFLAFLVIVECLFCAIVVARAVFYREAQAYAAGEER